ncbi:uncharacterized protein LOC114324353 [Diabrotica virgifera virgifera]|uniref:Uncharacterized protein LOC114324353 n=1 Tax=Diabrotica virgifera virgifera TaxID=50390 RepID=A0A6P7F218_DIAVI|nr:uncharacterized protein LOC114324353 [Diabrotica virgifera virgifera]
MEPATFVMISPFEDFLYLFNSVLLGESSVEDIILLVGTLVAFVAFILWCCFPVTRKESPVPGLQPLDKNAKDEGKYNQLTSDYIST